MLRSGEQLGAEFKEQLELSIGGSISDADFESVALVKVSTCTCIMKSKLLAVCINFR